MAEPNLVSEMAVENACHYLPLSGADGNAGCELISLFATVIVYLSITPIHKSHFLPPDKSTWRHTAAVREICCTRGVFTSHPPPTPFKMFIALVF